MKQPIIVAVDDDPQVLRAISRDLKEKYRKEYRIISSDSAIQTLDFLKELKSKSETVALILSDQRMPEMLGVEFLEKAKSYYPDAKRALLTAYSDTDAAIRAINEVQLNYYFTKPWDPPEEKLFPVIDELLDDWFITYRPEFEGIKLIGYQFSPQSHTIKDYLSGNLVPYLWLDIESQPKAKELMDSIGVTEQQLPILIFEDGSFARNPSLSEIGAKIGRQLSAKSDMYDVVIIGAGPSGLAAAVYGASEGLKTILIEKRAPGGQAGTSSRIENYLGFPNGLSGAELTKRAVAQATRFGAEFLSPVEVKEISIKDGYKILHLVDGKEVKSKSVVISTGVDYRYLGALNEEKFTGAGIYYGAANTEVHACENKPVYIVGGGNSAGQAAMFLSKFAEKVHIVIRREDLTSGMSSYLIDQINNVSNIEILPFTEVKEVHGDTYLNAITLRNIKTDECRKANATALFIFIGAKPNTGWLSKDILLDPPGFILTGRDLLTHDAFSKIWKHERDPFLLETSIPGIFASGDVRSGAMARVASAVGEGSMSISMVHRYLAEN